MKKEKIEYVLPMDIVYLLLFMMLIGGLVTGIVFLAINKVG